MRRVVGVAAAGLVAAVAACQLLAGIERVDTVDRPPDAGPPDTGFDAGPPPDPCQHAFVPLPPATDDNAGLDVLPFVLALDSTSMTGAVDGGAPVGYDLDRVCTCFDGGGAPSCSRDAAPVCDLGGGIDNELGVILDTYGAIYSVNEGVDFNHQISQGQKDLLIYVSKYNGLANDKEVFVNLLRSNGIFEDGCDGGADLDAEGFQTYPATWGGCDKWSVDPSSGYVNLDNIVPLAPPARGYVTNNVLVVTLGVDVPLVYGAAFFYINAPLVTARITPIDGGPLFHLDDGVVGGRLSVGNALQAIGTMSFGDGGEALCKQGEFFAALKNQFICPKADIMASGVLDNDPKAMCDALSFAIGFTARPAEFGTHFLRGEDAGSARCDADAANPMYSCPPH